MRLLKNQLDILKRGEVDFLIDDYENSKVISIEIKSGKDYMVHSAINNLISTNKKYIDKAYVFSNNYEVVNKDDIIYLPIYYIMFL